MYSFVYNHIKYLNGLHNLTKKHSVLHKKVRFLCNTEYLLNKTAQNKEVKNRNPLPLYK